MSCYDIIDGCLCGLLIRIFYPVKYDIEGRDYITIDILPEEDYIFPGAKKNMNPIIEL